MRDPAGAGEGARPPSTPDWEGKEQHGRGARSVDEDPDQRWGAGRVARQGACGWVIAVGSGAAVAWPCAHLDRGAHRA